MVPIGTWRWSLLVPGDGPYWYLAMVPIGTWRWSLLVPGDGPGGFIDIAESLLLIRGTNMAVVSCKGHICVEGLCYFFCRDETGSPPKVHPIRMCVSRAYDGPNLT